jgi:hypothetical protein
MRHLVLLAISLVLFSQNSFANDIYQNADKSIVLIYVKFPGKSNYGAGSGFMVAPQIIATNHHVIEDAVKIVTLTPDRTGEGKSHPAEVIWSSPKSDLALLRVPTLNLPAIVLAEKLPAKGNQVTAIGYPGEADNVIDFKGIESTLTQGVIGRIIDSPWIEGGPNIKIIQHSAAINKGNSGGPLLDNCGRVIGINTGKTMGRIVKDSSGGYAVSQSDGISLAVSTSALMNGLKASNISYTTTDLDCAINQIAATKSGGLNPILSLIGILFAVILAGAALFFSVRKREVIRETFTQFQRRKPTSELRPQSHKEIGKTWLLKGEYPDGRSIEFKLNSALFERGNIFVGRDAALCKIVLDDLSVSRKHVLLELSRDTLKISDLNSTNGTWLDREKIGSTPISLRYGQVITFGKVRVKLESISS